MTSSGVLHDSVVSQIDWWWHALFRRRLDGLTDDELWWAPVDDAWTLHRGDDGEYRYEWPPGSLGETTPPFTTLAWRLCHLSLSGLAHWALLFEGVANGGEVAMAMTFPSTADEAVARTDEWWTRWRAGLGALDDDALRRPIGATSWCGELGERTSGMKLGPNDPAVNFVLHHQRELIHHGAEISMLRDLYRATKGTA
ncbi:MAG: hypothetical protein V7636_1387 [Actinomycetota bacterium]|jgi:hypothetical protein